MANPEIDNYVTPVQQQSPEPLPTSGVRVEFSIDRLRGLGAIARKNKGGFTSEQVKAFLALYDEELNDLLNQTVRKFVEEKLS
jgi:hypothetical protein